MFERLLGIRGHLIDAPRPGELRSIRGGAVVIDSGLIAEVGDYETLRKKPRSQEVRWLYSDNVALMPGLVDLHSHVPQYRAVAHGQSELLPWLRDCIFPVEREFTGARARREAARFFQELAKQGTTTAALYTAIYEDTCDAAFEAARGSGLRIVMGKMMMDVGSYGEQQPKRALSFSVTESTRLCRKWHGANDGLLGYAFSPRFAVSCSRELMCAAAELAREHGAWIQTHLSENREELARVRELFPEAEDYTAVYESCGLLTPRTVLGHCIHLSPREREAIAAAGAAIAHCPTANLFLGSGILPFEKMNGIRLGLGTDVAAGPELNLWRVMRAAIESQKARSFYEPGVRVPTAAEVFYLATQGGAEALGKGDAIGSFEIGKEADLAIIDFSRLLPYGKDPKRAADLSAEDILALCVYRGGPEALLESFVRGRSVYRAPDPELF